GPCCSRSAPRPTPAASSVSCAYDPPSRLRNALAGGKRSRNDTVAVCNVCSSGGPTRCCRAERASSARQDVAAVPAPGAILVAAHPARIRALGPLVPPVVPFVGIEAAVGVIIAIIVVA